LITPFDVTITGDEVKKPKPDPEGIQKCLGLLHNSTDEVIFVGDSETDIVLSHGEFLDQSLALS